MRFINKTTVCVALGLILLYIVGKRRADDERPASKDAAPEYANLAEDAPVVSVTADAPPPVDVTDEVATRDDSAHDTQADTDVAEHPDLSVYKDAFEQEDTAIDEPPSTGDTQDTQADTDVVAQPDISLGEDAFEREDAVLDEPPPAGDTQDTNTDADVVAQPDLSLDDDEVGQEDAALDDDAVEQADDAIDEPTPASEVTPKPKSPSSPQRRRSAQPPPKRQRRPAARTQPKRRTRPRRHMGRRVRTGAYYPPLSPPTERASLRCRETGEGWEIYIALPQARAVVKVTHGGDELDYLQASSETELPLSQFTGDAIVHYHDDTADRITLLSATAGEPLLFKMQENWEGEGRLVSNPTVGHILAIVSLDYADEWDVDEPHEPEDCVDESFEARFLFLEGVAPGRPAPMVIKGTTLHDDVDADTEYHGKPYIGAPPELRVDPQITDARIVEETGVREDNKWGENFNPHRQSIASMLDGREGRFSIRTYHDGTSNEESKPFRYFPALRRITLNGEPHSPDIALLPDKRTGKHREIALRFEIDDGDALCPESVSHDEVRIADDGAVIIPPSPSIQAITCDFHNRASIAVAVPHVWWRLTDEDGATGDWCGETYEFSRSEFMNLTKARIEIRTPPAIKAVEIGFGDETLTEFKASQGAVEFGLMGFVYYKDVFDAPDKTLHLNIRVNGQTAPIARVLADVALDESAADKALLNLPDRHALSVPPHGQPTPNTARRFRGADVFRSDRRRRPHIPNKKSSAVSGVVILIDQGSYMLEITRKSGQHSLGILQLDEMTTMTEAERAEITVGQELLVCVIKEAPPGHGQSVLLSVDKLTDANYNADEE